MRLSNVYTHPNSCGPNSVNHLSWIGVVSKHLPLVVMIWFQSWTFFSRCTDNFDRRSFWSTTFQTHKCNRPIRFFVFLLTWSFWNLTCIWLVYAFRTCICHIIQATKQKSNSCQWVSKLINAALVWWIRMAAARYSNLCGECMFGSHERCQAVILCNLVSMKTASNVQFRYAERERKQPVEFWQMEHENV